MRELYVPFALFVFSLPANSQELHFADLNARGIEKFGQVKIPDRAADVAELTRLAAESGHAYASRDITALKRLTAEDYVQTDVRGGVLTREQSLESVKNCISELAVETDDVQISFYGETAVMRGHWIYTRSEEGKKVVTHSRWTSVWTRTADGWKHHVFQNAYVNSNADRCAINVQQ